MKTHINGPLLRQRRIEAALSLRQAATLLSVGAPTLARIESNDSDAERALSVGALLNLADALGCTPADLFHDPTAQAVEEAGSSAVNPEVLIGVLQASPKQVSLKDLAIAFGTTTADIRAAADAAAERLSGTGLRVGRRNDMLFIASTRNTDVARRMTVLERTTSARSGIDNGAARVLQQVLAGRLNNGRRSAYTQSALALLDRLGMVTTTDQGPTPSDAVKYALDVP